MARKRSIRDMCMAAYDDDELAEAVITHANLLGTTAQIERGELTLPSEIDATHWHRRNQGLTESVSERDAQVQRIQRLEQLFADHASRTPVASDVAYVDSLKARIAALEGGG